MGTERPEMSEEQRFQFQQLTRGYGDQDENGIDLSQLWAKASNAPSVPPW